MFIFVCLSIVGFFTCLCLILFLLFVVTDILLNYLNYFRQWLHKFYNKCYDKLFGQYIPSWVYTDLNNQKHSLIEIKTTKDSCDNFSALSKRFFIVEKNKFYLCLRTYKQDDKIEDDIILSPIDNPNFEGIFKFPKNTDNLLWTDSRSCKNLSPKKDYYITKRPDNCYHIEELTLRLKTILLLKYNWQIILSLCSIIAMVFDVLTYFK